MRYSMDNINYTGETKEQRFKRVASRRTQKVLEALRILGNCANRAEYEYTEEDVRKIFSAIEKQLADVKARFRTPGRLKFEL
ncbi:MAG: hypothetical protein ABIK22_01690 [candidate division WOR-3 bacterium]